MRWILVCTGYGDEGIHSLKFYVERTVEVCPMEMLRTKTLH